MNLATLVGRAAEWHSTRTAVICRGKERTFSEIAASSNRFANALLSLGLEKGDRVGLYADNSVEYFETIFGVFKAGAAAVGVNTMLSANEAAFLIRDSGAKIVVTSSAFVGDVLRMKAEIPALETVVCIGDGQPGALDYGAFMDAKSSEAPQVEIDENDLARLSYTGGTTGVPKGVMISHRVLSTLLLNMQADFCHIYQDDVVLSPGSLAHANLSYSLLCFIQGAKLIIPEGYNPPDILSTIQREKVTVLPGYPTTLIRLIDSPDIDQYDLSTVRLVTYGASPMPTDKLRRALEVFGCKLAQGYGQAEAPMTITYLTPEDHAFALAQRPERLASCGRPYMSMEVRVVDDNGKDVPHREMGEVIVRGWVSMLGYWKNPKATDETVRDGWIHTGDVGWMDEEGYLYLVDRKKDAIKTGGLNVYAREVEDVLNSHPAVAEAAVIGVPDDEWGEAVKAVVALKPGSIASDQQIMQFCRSKLAGYKKPKSIDFLPELPKTAAGKIAKRLLRDPYWEGRERKI